MERVAVNFEVRINKFEVLRYLGYKNQSINQNINSLIEECIEEVKNDMDIRYIYKILDIDKSKDNIQLFEASLTLQGNDIYRHLKNSHKCAILAVTLGNNIDSKIKYYGRVNLTKSIIFDACATAAVEEACDYVEELIKKDTEKQKLYLTGRYSPGYGDFPIAVQSSFINILDAYRKIGLASNESYILIPQKSITAVIGLQNQPNIIKDDRCSVCSSYKKCVYRREGKPCEY